MAACLPYVALVVVLLTPASATSAAFYADNGLQQTVMYRTLAKRERREVQQEILHLLGLQHRPRPRKHEVRSSAPRYLMDLYTSFLDRDSGGLRVTGHWLANTNLHAVNDSDVIMSFVNRLDHDAPHLRHDRERRLWFDISEVPVDETIMGAELRMYRDRGLQPNRTCTISVYAFIQGLEPENKNLQLVDSLEISAHTNGWLVFNVTEPVVTWVAFPQQNLGLYLKLREAGTGRSLSPHEAGLVGAKGDEEKQPFMVAFFQTPSHVHSRKTRAAKKRQQTDVTYYDHDDWNMYAGLQEKHPSRRSCQRWTLYVSFRDLGWQDWIIAPDGYGAFYCHGECSFPLNAHMNATNHAIVQTLVHLMDPRMVPKPCCAPTQLSAITVLYFDDNSNVILKKYKNMVVKSCGCH